MADQIYLEQVKNILENGLERKDRTGVGTISLFGLRMEFDVSQLPLLTTKKMAWKSVIQELLFFINGKTDTSLLEKEGVKIWTGNTSEEFLKKRGLNYKKGDMGPMYGYQWRHFNAEYRGCEEDYTNEGIDQLENLIEEIRIDPTSRRLICTAWNPCQVSQGVLPPCHILFQLYIRDEYLDLQLYQRSGDMMLGIPFNIFSYSVLLMLIAYRVSKKPGRLIHIIGDAHIYSNHIEGAKLQITRIATETPILTIRYRKNWEYGIDDFSLTNYKPHPPIKFEMAV